METYTFHVDTKPMAEAIDTVSDYVAQTKNAVDYMHKAVVEAEEQASERICRNVTTGFHILIQSQVSQKAAAYFSEMSSKLVLISQIAKNLSSTMERMNGDYQRLKREYAVVFNGLDKALEHRVKQLDRYANELNESKKTIILKKAAKDAPAALVYGKDNSNTAQSLFSARMKSRTSSALASIADNVLTANYYQGQINEILADYSGNNNIDFFIPVIITEEKGSYSAETAINNIYISDEVGTNQQLLIKNTIMQDIDKYINNISGDEEESIKKEFMKLVSSSGLDNRVAEKIVSLFNGTDQPAEEVVKAEGSEI